MAFYISFFLPFVLMLPSVGLADQPVTPLGDFGKTMVGRWKADLSIPIELEGFGKKGEVTVNYLDFRWVADKRAIESSFHCGAATGQALVFWDAAEQSVRERCVSSDGRTYELAFSKDGDNWAWSLEGSLGDGSSLRGNGHYIIRDKGNEFVSDGVLSVGGEEDVPFRHVYKRLN